LLPELAGEEVLARILVSLAGMAGSQKITVET
jgi:hypothetical protein